MQRRAMADDGLAHGNDSRTSRARCVQTPPCTGAHDCGRNRSPARRICAARCDVRDRPHAQEKGRDMSPALRARSGRARRATARGSYPLAIRRGVTRDARTRSSSSQRYQVCNRVCHALLSGGSSPTLRRSTRQARECRPSQSSANTRPRRASTCRCRGSPSRVRRSARHTRCLNRRASTCRR